VACVEDGGTRAIGEEIESFGGGSTGDARARALLLARPSGIQSKVMGR
jgi:hypothetical protein